MKHALKSRPHPGTEGEAIAVMQAITASAAASLVQVDVTHRSNGRIRHRIRGFTATSARKSMFETKEGKKLSVEQYFK